MELSGEGDSYARSFAGDTYNSAVYAKRRHSSIDVQFLTAVGVDPVSQAMVAQWDRDQVGHSLVGVSEIAHPGIYAIATDDDGERSFTYWRAASAATEFVALLTDSSRRAVMEFNYIYFSGITLAILSEKDRASFLELIAEAKNSGQTISFDPNYRAALWRDADQAAHWLTEAYRLTDIAFPGLADHQAVFGHQSTEDVRVFLQDLQTREIVMKAGTADIYCYSSDQNPVHLRTTLANNPCDTTGAGDSFAGTYLAERIMLAPVESALASAARVAKLVVQHPGAIVSETLYHEYLNKDL